MGLSILGIGTAVPPNSANQEDATRIAREFICTSEYNDRWFRKVFNLSAVESRGSVVLESPGELGATQSFYPTTAFHVDGASVGDRVVSQGSVRIEHTAIGDNTLDYGVVYRLWRTGHRLRVNQ